MVDHARTYARLSPGLQQKLAQLALLQQRKPLLAAMPRVVLTKGKPVQWAATPAPLLLRQVMIIAAGRADPKVSALVLRNWFQHKRELYYHVRQSLLQTTLLTGPLPVLPHPAPTVLRLPTHLRGPGPDGLYYQPKTPLSAEVEASPEEITLMAELQGWCTRRPALTEVDPDDEHLQWLRLAYQSLDTMRQMLADVLAHEPADSPAARLAAQGELPQTVSAATEAALDWANFYALYLPLHDNLCKAGQELTPNPDEPRRLADAEAAATYIEDMTVGVVFRANSKLWMLDSLAMLGRVYHIQQPDFAPLAALQQQARAYTEQVAAESPYTGDHLAELVTGFGPLLRLIDWINDPNELGELDPQDKALQELAAVVEPAVFNALLLHKLRIADEAPDAAAAQRPAGA